MCRHRCATSISLQQRLLGIPLPVSGLHMSLHRHGLHIAFRGCTLRSHVTYSDIGRLYHSLYHTFYYYLIVPMIKHTRLPYPFLRAVLVVACWCALFAVHIGYSYNNRSSAHIQMGYKENTNGILVNLLELSLRRALIHQCSCGRSENNSVAFLHFRC